MIEIAECKTTPVLQADTKQTKKKRVIYTINWKKQQYNISVQAYKEKLAHKSNRK